FVKSCHRGYLDERGPNGLADQYRINCRILQTIGSVTEQEVIEYALAEQLIREVRDLRPGDWPEVARIYAEGIQTGNATFETEIPSWQAWDAAHLDDNGLVAEDDARA